MKITDIEIIPIHPRLAERYDNPEGRARMGDIDCRMVFKVTTDAGIVGYGDYDWPGPPPPRSMVEPLIGRSPFDFMLADVNLGLGVALYDAMGKYLDVPAYKLLGQKVRDAGAVAAWTRPCPAGVFAGEVQRAVDEGYRVFKMHTSPEYDPLRQAEAAADVAPDGFRLHYDFNGAGRSLGVLKPLVAEMERNHPIVGFIEDPLPRTDVEGWRRLRDQTTIPIVHGGGPALGGHYEMASGMADIFMLGGPIGDTVQRGIAAARANMQVIMQLTGGTLMKAMTLHLMAVLPTASAHSINLDDQYAEDITTERIPVDEGFSPVPEGPGLGFEVDEAMLRKVASNAPIEETRPRVIGVLRLPNGTVVHTPRRAVPQRITGMEEGAVRGIDFGWWEDDDSPEFDEAYARMKEAAEASGQTVVD